jgi:hypothetical protein
MAPTVWKGRERGCTSQAYASKFLEKLTKLSKERNISNNDTKIKIILKSIFRCRILNSGL